MSKRLFSIALSITVAVAATLLAGCAGTAPDPRAGAIAELGSTGRLRAAINFGNPILANRGANGEPTGVSVDLAREAGGASACRSNWCRSTRPAAWLRRSRRARSTWPSSPSTRCAPPTPNTPRPT